MRITELRVESFMGVEMIDMKVDNKGGLVLIGGKNGSGKTSLMAAIECVMAGKRLHPDKPIKTGAKRSSIVLKLGELTLVRKFTPKGTTITITNADGFQAKSPQKLLDELYNAISFDPAAFAGMKDVAQLDLVRRLCGIDTTALDQEHETHYANRTVLNRQIKDLEIRQEGFAHDPSVPDEEVSVMALMEELEQVQATNAKHDLERKHLADLAETAKQEVRTLEAASRAIEETDRGLEAMRSGRSTLKLSYQGTLSKGREQKAIVDALVDEDPAIIKQRISEADAVNAVVRRNQELKVLNDRELKFTAEADALGDQIEDVATRRRALLDSIKMPIKELTIGVNGLEFNGVPFSQASSAERLQTSIAMAIALHPKLQVMLVRDGEKLDDESLALMAKLAEESGHQVWTERVGSKDAGAIVISEGRLLSEIEDEADEEDHESRMRAEDETEERIADLEDEQDRVDADNERFNG